MRFAQGGCENGCVYILFSELLLGHSHVFILLLNTGTVYEVTTIIIRLLQTEGQFHSKLLRQYFLDPHQKYPRPMTIMTLPYTDFSPVTDTRKFESRTKPVQDFATPIHLNSVYRCTKTRPLVP